MLEKPARDIKQGRSRDLYVDKHVENDAYNTSIINQKMKKQEN